MRRLLCPRLDATHKGGPETWSYCPWCGAELMHPGVCRFCRGPASSSYSMSCDACWLPRIAREYLNGHTLEALALLYAAGESWATIARAFGLSKPRSGPRDVQTAAGWFWSAAGSPGSTPAPDLPHTCRRIAGREWRYPCDCQPWQEWYSRQIDARDTWLREQATDLTEVSA
jgi:hypothetical protein